MFGRNINSFVALLVLLGGFAVPLVELMRFALGDDLESHIILIPVVSAYLLAQKWPEITLARSPSPRWAVFWGAGALIALMFYLRFLALKQPVNGPEALAFSTLGFVCGVLAIAAGAFGAEALRAAAFPLGFLFFMVPLPGRLVDLLQTALQYSSAEVLAWMYVVTRMPVSREGLVFQMPNLALEVAEECSGIHSTLVLIPTCLVAGYFFLRNPGHRALLVVVAIPLGILRNAFRIWVISWLCIQVSPDMINSPIHSRGGPVFFALSMALLALLIVLLRRWESRREAAGAQPAGTAGPGRAAGGAG